MFPLNLQKPAGTPPAGDGFVDVLALEALAVGGQHVAQLGLRRVLLCRTSDSELHAVSDICPHALQPLAGGEVANGTIRCPKHGARFELCSGKALNAVTKAPLPVHAVRIRDGRIEVASLPNPQATP